MSNAMAIAAVTAALRNWLEHEIARESGLDDTAVTTKPPDQARTNNNNANQLNLFLYQTELSPTWRNMDLPWQVKPGERGNPPLGLNLYYLITAYGKDNDDVLAHRLLGRAMSLLHDYPSPTREQIRDALDGNDLHEQVEQVRITPQPLSLDEMSKLWTTFQTQYRISMAYEVAVVLIESTRPVRKPLPVLRRGDQDQGVDTVLGPFPVLEELFPESRQPGDQPVSRQLARLGVQLGDLLVIRGQNLAGQQVRLRFSPQRASIAARELDPEPGATATELKVKLPDDDKAQTEWPAGVYAVTAAIKKQAGDAAVLTNRLPLTLLPRLTLSPPSDQDNPTWQDKTGRVTLTLTCRPQVLPEQAAVLLIGDRRFAAQPRTAPTHQLTFEGVDLPAADFAVLRLQVDEAEQIPVKETGHKLEFDPEQKVKLEPLIVKIEPDPAPPDANGRVTLAVTCGQPVQPDLSPVLWLAGQAIAAEPHPAPTNTLTFVTTPPAGVKFITVRLELKQGDQPPVKKVYDNSDYLIGLVFNPAYRVELKQ